MENIIVPNTENLIIENNPLNEEKTILNKHNSILEKVIMLVKRIQDRKTAEVFEHNLNTHKISISEIQDILEISEFQDKNNNTNSHVVSILATTIIKGVPGLHWTLFTNTMFSASYMDPVGNGGLLHAIVGTLYLIVLSIQVVFLSLI